MGTSPILPTAPRSVLTVLRHPRCHWPAPRSPPWRPLRRYPAGDGRGPGTSFPGVGEPVSRGERTRSDRCGGPRGAISSVRDLKLPQADLLVGSPGAGRADHAAGLGDDEPGPIWRKSGGKTWVVPRRDDGEEVSLDISAYDNKPKQDCLSRAGLGRRDAVSRLGLFAG